MNDPEINAVIISFFVGAMAFAAWRNKFLAVALPTIGTFIILGYLESKRPYTGGGASFYILIQLIVCFYAYGAAWGGMYIVNKLFPREGNDGS